MRDILDEMETTIGPPVKTRHERTKIDGTTDNVTLGVASSDSERFLVMNAFGENMKLLRLLVPKQGMNRERTDFKRKPRD